MKKKIFLLVFVFNMLLISAQNISVVSVSGTVQYKRGGAGEWIPVNTQTVLHPNDLIFTGFRSGAVLRMASGTLQVQPLTQVSLSTLMQSGSTLTTNVRLTSGQVTASVDKIELVQNVFMVSSTNTTASVRGTKFTFGNDSISVDEGRVRFADSLNRSTMVSRGETASFNAADFSLNSPTASARRSYSMANNIAGMSEGESDTFSGTAAGSGSPSRLIINITVR